MKFLNVRFLAAWLTSMSRRDEDRERGDVPGWVMVTVITRIGLRRSLS